MLRGHNKHLVKRWIDAPVMWDLHCSFIRHDLCWANSNQLLNYESSRPCLHYGGGFPDWLGECLIAVLPRTQAWHTHAHTQSASVCAYTINCLHVHKYAKKNQTLCRCTEYTLHGYQGDNSLPMKINAKEHKHTTVLLPDSVSRQIVLSSSPFTLCWSLQPAAELASDIC